MPGAQIDGFNGAEVTRINKEGDLVAWLGNNGIIANISYIISGGGGKSVPIPEGSAYRKLPIVGLVNHPFGSNYSDATAEEIRSYMDNVK